MSLHLAACAAYRKEFLDKYGYEFCEVCSVNGNGTMKFEVHHIYMASLYPRHPQLHNFLNLILICIECHMKFHGNQLRREFEALVTERGLKKLFHENQLQN